MGVSQTPCLSQKRCSQYCGPSPRLSASREWHTGLLPGWNHRVETRIEKLREDYELVNDQANIHVSDAPRSWRSMTIGRWDDS